VSEGPDPLSYCARLLKQRLRSRHELETAMTRRGIEASAQQGALASLAELGLVDDLRLAKAWVHDRDRLAPRGAAVLRQELILKGISREVIDQVLADRKAEAADEEAEQPSELDLARRLAAGKERLYAGLSEEVRRRRLAGFLQRRGFSYDVVRRILEG
jgi:regulatory protein